MTAKENPFSLDGKVAVVTGGASGIGAGIAAMLAGAGAMTVIVDINGEGAEARAAQLREEGLKADAQAIDLADESAIVNGCAAIVQRHGTPWALVNNAGLQDRELLLEGTAEFWDLTNNINARGPYFMIREIARAMVEKGEGGRIVNIASAALTGSIVKGLVAYSASKGALQGISIGAAFELVEHGITVNTVLPGGVATPGSINAKGPPPEGPARRELPLGLCEPADIAGALFRLAGGGQGHQSGNCRGRRIFGYLNWQCLRRVGFRENGIGGPALNPGGVGPFPLFPFLRRPG